MTTTLCFSRISENSVIASSSDSTGAQLVVPCFYSRWYCLLLSDSIVHLGFQKPSNMGPYQKKKANLPSEKRKCNLYTVAGESKKERVGIRGKFSQRKLITGTILSFGLNFWQSFDCFVKHDQIFLTTEALL